jgi:hypothetical protein
MSMHVVIWVTIIVGIIVVMEIRARILESAARHTEKWRHILKDVYVDSDYEYKPKKDETEEGR